MSKWFRWIGLALLVIGILAVILPYVAALTVNILVGIVLLIAGVLHLAHVMQVRKWRSVTWEGLLSILFLLVGILFLAYPFSGILALTIVLSLFFLLHAGFKIPLAMNWKPRPGWGWFLSSGILSAILGLLILLGLPGSAVWAIGLILGIDLLFTGVTLLALGSKMKGLAG
jgi:uncharacterized membrane protein HdeD (DUF308 family)